MRRIPALRLPGYRVAEVLSDAGGRFLLRCRSETGDLALVLCLPIDEQGGRTLARCRLAFDLARSADCPAVPRPREVGRSPSFADLVVEDPGGRLLSAVIPREGLRLDHLMEAALALAVALRHVHRASLLLRDLRPETVLIAPDFATAFFPTLDQAAAQLGLGGFITADDGLPLSYVAPELTGRIEVPADRRADLYALGATLFHMACGRPPFTGSAEEVAYAHLAVPPPDLQALRPELPQMFCRIVARLLQKDPDERYETVYDLAADLGRCAGQFRKSGAIRPFELSRGTPTPEFGLSAGFFGRRREIALLVDALEQGAAAGKRTLVTVHGASGIGKSALVNQLQWSLARTGAHFHAGKFDKFRQDQPYSAMAATVQSMMRAVLRSGPGKILRARSDLQQAMGVHGKLLTDLVPELAGFLGPQPAFDTLLPTEAALRFNEVVGRFIRVFATPQTPLIVFIDDLQWADRASVSLLASIAHMSGLSHFMLVLGYRSDELPALHPAQEAIAELRKSADKAVDIPLAELAVEDMAAFVADTLRRSDAATSELAAVIHKISEGNIFFAREHLQYLAETGALRFDEAASAWAFDTEVIRAAPPPAGTVSFLTRRLDKLPRSALALLDTASCIGNEFDVRTLMQVHRLPAPEIAAALAPAVDLSIVLPLGEQHRLLAALDGVEDGAASAADPLLEGASYRFRHDQVRAVVHQRLDAERRARLHLRIGNLIYDALDAEELPQRAIEIFRHYVWAAEVMKAPDERQRCASLGLIAGVQAIAGLAFDSARQYLEIADAALPEDPWRNAPELKQPLQLALAECALALNDWTTLERVSEEFGRHVTDPVAIAQMMGFRIRKMSTEKRLEEAVDLCIETVRQFGLRLPRRPTALHVLKAVAALLASTAFKDPRQLANIPETSDPKVKAIVHLLQLSFVPAYFVEPNLLPLLAIEATRTSIKGGTCRGSSYALAVVGFLLSGSFGMTERGYLYGEVACTMSQRFGESDQAHTTWVFNTFLRHLKEPLGSIAEELVVGWSRSRAAGDQEDATYGAGVFLRTDFLSGRSATSDLRQPDMMDYLDRIDMPHVRPSFMASVQLLQLLRGEALPDDLAGPRFVYPLQVAQFISENSAVQVASSSVAAGILDHLAGRLQRAEERFALAHEYRSGIFSQVVVPMLEFYRSRNAFMMAQSVPGQRRRMLRLARKLMRSLSRRAPHNPVGLGGLSDLLRAESAAASGRPEKALMALHQVAEMTAAEAPLYAYMAQRRIADVLRGRGLHHQAAKAAQLARRHALDWGSPCLAADTAADFDLPDAGLPQLTRDAAPQQQVDLRGFVDLLGAVSSEQGHEGLLTRVLGTVLAGTNADVGLAALAASDGTVRVRARADGPKAAASCDEPLAAASEVARQAVGAVLTAGRLLHVADGAAAASHVPYPKTYLCVPIERNGRLLGAIYLENKVTRLAFTEARISFAQAFASHAGIVLENARLLAGIEEALKLQTQQAEANRRFVPEQFLAALQVGSIGEVGLNQATLRETAIVFADLRGFTRLAEQLGPTGTIATINRYLDHVQPGIAANGGYVVQYYGDGILALFPSGADAALFGVAAMVRGLAAYNRTRGDFPELSFGVGVHYGPVLLGVIGDPDHMQCSVIGDAVNTASRIEALTKEMQAPILVSGDVVSRLRQPEKFTLRALGPVDVRGRGTPVELYGATV